MLFIYLSWQLFPFDLERLVTDLCGFLFQQYSGINIGPVHKKDVMKASVMLEHDPQ